MISCVISRATRAGFGGRSEMRIYIVFKKIVFENPPLLCIIGKSERDVHDEL